MNLFKCEFGLYFSKPCYCILSIVYFVQIMYCIIIVLSEMQEINEKYKVSHYFESFFLMEKAHSLFKKMIPLARENAC